MFKRSGVNYSLWPEQRPRRGRPMKFAAGGFVLGAVCAAAYGLFFNFTGSATGHRLGAQRVAAPISIVVERQPPVEAAVPVPAPSPAEAENRLSSPRAATVEVTLPLIGTPSPRPSAAMEGRGDDGLAGEVRLTEPDAGADTVPSLLGDESERTLHKTPAKSAESTPAAGVPVPRAAPPQTAAVDEAGLPTSQASAGKESVDRPIAVKAATDGAARQGRTAPRPKRRGVVLTQPGDAMTLAGGDDAHGPPVRPTNPAVAEPPAKTWSVSERRGFVVVKKADKRLSRRPRADDVPAREPAGRTAKSKKTSAAAVRDHRAKPRKSHAEELGKAGTLRRPPPRQARKADAPYRQPPPVSAFISDHAGQQHLSSLNGWRELHPAELVLKLPSECAGARYGQKSAWTESCFSPPGLTG